MSRRGCSGTAITARGYYAHFVSSVGYTMDTKCCLLHRPTRPSRWVSVQLVFDCVEILMFAAQKFQLLLLVFQDKVTKEVNFILANQETIQNQITQLEDAIKQMEVNYLFSVLYLLWFVKLPVIFFVMYLCTTALVRGSVVLFSWAQWNWPSHAVWN